MLETVAEKQRMAPPATLDLRSSRPLDLSMYGVLVVMGGLGIADLSGTGARVAAIALCLAFGLVNAIGPRLARSEAHMVMHFAIQTILVTALIALRSDAYETFAFLFLMLSVHVVLVLRPWLAVSWIVLFWLISSAGSLWFRGEDALFTILFNLGVYPVCGVFGYALREMALARRDSEATLVQLRSAQQQLQQLAIADERNRLARDLHDSVKQQVFATIMQLGAARVLLDRDPASARQALDEAEQLAQRAGAGLNLVIHELRPVELDDRELSEALESYAADWSRQSSIRAVARVTGDHHRLPATTEHALLRVAQEALANVARHSNATSIRLELDCQAKSTALMITDDGDGFDLSQPPAGIGLASMRERVEVLGGTLTVSSEPGAGTSINVRLEASHA